MLILLAPSLTLKTRHCFQRLKNAGNCQINLPPKDGADWSIFFLCQGGGRKRSLP